MPSLVPDHIRAAIHAGHIGQVVIFCDRCGVEARGDYTGETREIRFAAARRNLAETGWHIGSAYDGCPQHPPDKTSDALRGPWVAAIDDGDGFTYRSLTEAAEADRADELRISVVRGTAAPEDGRMPGPGGRRRA